MSKVFQTRNYSYPFNWRVLLLGQNGSGKTYAAKKLADLQYGRVKIVCYQAKPRDTVLDKLDVVRVSGVGELNRYRQDPMIILRPPPDKIDDPDLSEEFCLWALNQGPIIIWLNETANFTQERPKPTRGFSNLVKMGRSLGIGMIMETQEPAYTPRIVFSESRLILRFYLNNAVSLKAIRDKAPIGLDMPLLPGQHAFNLWDERLRSQVFQFTTIA